MNEEYLQFIWEHKLFDDNKLVTTDGKSVSVTFPGFLNHDSGPDFFAARLTIDSVEWCGNVEIHLSASEWHQHGHNADRAYDNVILHVVFDYDQLITTTNGSSIPTLELSDRIYGNSIQKYLSFQAGKNWVLCADSIRQTPIDIQQDAIRDALITRVRRKAKAIQHEAEKLRNDWSEVVYRNLMKNFGFKVNSVPFAILSNHVSYKIIKANADNPFVIEALLFGVAGFLEEAVDPYHVQLKKEFLHQARKYRLESLPHHIWKFSRMRPNNFPVLRLGQIAQILSNASNLVNQITCISNLNEGELFLQEIVAHPYWKNHCHFGKEITERSAVLGKSAVHNILINTVAPVQYAIGLYKSNYEMCEQSLNLLCRIPAEKNGLIRKWKECGLIATSAAESQGLIELKNEMCTRKKCLSCAVGSNLMLKHD